ncbi:MAG: prephenate/arogenate dehydrogenase family protein [Pseudomonadota bacterium]|jgi:cyclohexadieny/prephenate dehydrogenase
MTPLFKKIAVVGCGLIGSSIVRGVREYGLAETIAIADANDAARAAIAELKLGDSVHADPREAVREADLVVVATPPAAIGAVAETIAEALAPGAILTDVGSVKESVGQAMAAAAPSGVHVIPGHPISGTERSGPEAGFSALFKGRWAILCPQPSEDAAYLAAVERLAAFWRGLDSQVELMEARHHDLVLAVTSHLPHLIAYNIVGTAADLEEVTQAEVIKFSAGGFRDFTRIAASDPVMWRDVFMLNKDAVLEILGRFNEDLQALSRAIRWGEADKLQELFTRTRDIRRSVIAVGQESAEPNFGRDRS